MSSARPQSGFRRPQSGRSRPAAAAPPPPPAEVPSPPAPPGGDEDAYWLFSTAYRLTTSDISLAGFTTVVLLDAARWRGGDELTPEACAAAELAYTFGFDDTVAPTVTSEHMGALTQALEKCFVGRGGDLLIVFQNAVPETGDFSEDAAANVMARTVDLINMAYTSADDKGLDNMAGISVVMEGFAKTGLPSLKGKWDNGKAVSVDVLPFTDALPEA